MFENSLYLLADAGGRSELQLTYLQQKLAHDLKKNKTKQNKKTNQKNPTNPKL